MATKPEHVLNRIREFVNSEEFAEWVESEVIAMNNCPAQESASNATTSGSYIVDITLVNEDNGD